MQNLIQMARAIRNPQQAKQMMLQKIAQAKPELANVLNDMMSNNVPPKVAFKQAIEAGTLTKQQFYEAKQTFSQYGRFLPFKISNQEWNDLESIFNTKGNTNNTFRF